MLIVSWLLRILALLAAAFSFALFFRIEGELAKRAENIDNLKGQLSAVEKAKDEQALIATQAVARQNSLASELEAARKEANERRIQLTNATRRVEELESSVRSLRAANATQNEEIAKLKNDLLQKSTEGLEDEYRKLYEEAVKTVDTLRSNIVTLERERDEARQQATDAAQQIAGLTTPVSTNSELLLGEVIRVDDEGQLVVINLGRLNKISQSQRLVAYKPEKGVSFTLEVDTVGPDYSIARVVSTSGTRRNLPQVGDSVTNLF